MNPIKTSGFKFPSPKLGEEELVSKYAPLVNKISHRYYKHSSRECAAQLKDYIQAGNIGLLYAIRWYKEELGQPFISVASMCIAREIKRAMIKDFPMFRKPQNEQELYDNNPTVVSTNNILNYDMIDEDLSLDNLFTSLSKKEAYSLAVSQLNDDEIKILFDKEPSYQSRAYKLKRNQVLHKIKSFMTSWQRYHKLRRNQEQKKILH